LHEESLRLRQFQGLPKLDFSINSAFNKILYNKKRFLKKKKRKRKKFLEMFENVFQIWWGYKSTKYEDDSLRFKKNNLFCFFW
jgi:hypothetical protein